MANALLLAFIAIIFCLIAKSSVKCQFGLCLGGTGSINNAVSKQSNRSCTHEDAIRKSGVTYNVLWGGGSSSIITVDLTLYATKGTINTFASGKVVSGKYVDQTATFEFQFGDRNRTCESANGTSQLAGKAVIDILGNPPMASIYCSGTATLGFSPPLKSTFTPITSTLNVNFDACIGFGSCP